MLRAVPPDILAGEFVQAQRKGGKQQGDQGRKTRRVHRPAAVNRKTHICVIVAQGALCPRNISAENAIVFICRFMRQGTQAVSSFAELSSQRSSSAQLVDRFVKRFLVGNGTEAAARPGTASNRRAGAGAQAAGC